MMKNKMLISVFFPAIGKNYEFWIPRYYKIFYVNHMLIDFFISHPQGGYLPDENSMLCDRKTGRILNGNLSVDQLEKMNNPELMLI